LPTICGVTRSSRNPLITNGSTIAGKQR
jgi:hypothetical protein